MAQVLQEGYTDTDSAASQDLAWIMVLNIFFLFPYGMMKTADVNKNSSCQCDVEFTVCGYSPAAITAQYGPTVCSGVLGLHKRRELSPSKLSFPELGVVVQTGGIPFSKPLWLHLQGAVSTGLHLVAMPWEDEEATDPVRNI